mgnify:CR=1 FL=1
MYIQVYTQLEHVSKQVFIHIDRCRCYGILFLEIKNSFTGSGIDVVGNSSKRMRNAIWDVYDAVVLSDNNGDPLLYI